MNIPVVRIFAALLLEDRKNKAPDDPDSSSRWVPDCVSSWPCWNLRGGMLVWPSPMPALPQSRPGAPIRYIRVPAGTRYKKVHRETGLASAPLKREHDDRVLRSLSASAT